MSIPQQNDNYFEHRITKLEGAIENINASLIRIENNIKDLDKKYDAKMDRQFYWILGSILLPYLLKYFHVIP